jgi:PAS domain S-box-containing protein
MSKLENELPEIIKSLKSTYGNEFFNEIAKQLNKVIDVDYTFIAQIDNHKRIAQSISLVVNGNIADNFEYELLDTPCAVAINDSVCLYPKNICHYFPNDQLLIDMNIEGYIGVALYNSNGQVIGIIVALHKGEIKDPDFAKTLFELFSGRIAAELERSEQKKHLEELNVQLSSKVKELVESEHRLSIHLKNTPLGCITWDSDFCCTEWNAAAEKIFGFSEKEAVGTNLYELIIPKIEVKNIKEVQGALLENKGGYRKSNENITKQGHIILCDWYNTPIVDDAGKVKGVASLVQDITEREQQAELLHRTQKMDALGKLTGGIAHDQNNMLGVITGYAELLSLQLVNQPSGLKYVKKIENACQRSAKLIGKLLSFSRTSSSAKSKCNVNSVISEQQDVLQKMLTVKNQLMLNLCDFIWPAWLSQNDLKDAILNLCINAMHAMKNNVGSSYITILTDNIELKPSEAEILGVSSGKYIKLSVVDNGMGIDKPTLKKIFDPFFTTKGEEGTGLGLSQVFSFVKQSQGSIDVSSEVGEGCQFNLYLPCYQNERQVENSATIDPKDVSIGSESILVVDDEQELCDLSSEFLSMKGYKVFKANGYKQAVEIFKHQKIDLLFSDVVMPEMNGYQLASLIKAEYPLTKIQLTSGYTNYDTLEGIDESLRENLLVKPYSSEALYSKIRDLLDK